MKRSFVLALCAVILYPKISSSQERAIGPPTWVYVVGAGATLIIGATWYYKNFVKSPQSQNEKAFNEKALEEICYISTPAQRKALKKLNTPEEMAAFLQSFWQKLDPTPNTSENEVKDEHYRRWAYANAHFADHKEGWKTDRGRVYIIYGPPDEIERLPMIDLHFSSMAEPSIKALEMWIYYRPATGNESPNIFSDYNPGTAKFVFADFDDTGRYTQIYSSERGEISDPRVYSFRH